MKCFRDADVKPNEPPKPMLDPKDFFGSSPTSRSERKTFAKRKQVKNNDL